MANSRHRRRNDPRAVPDAAARRSEPASRPPVRRCARTARETPAAQAFAGLGDRRRSRHPPRRVPAPPPVQRPGDLGRDLFVVIIGEQPQPQRQIRDHVRGQLAVRPFLPHPAHRDRFIDRVPGHRVDQHPQRHLIRPHHHTLAHNRRPCQPSRLQTITPRRTDQELPAQGLDQLKLRGIGLRLGWTGGHFCSDSATCSACGPPQCFSRGLACNRRVQPPGLGGPFARVLTDNFAAHPLRVMPPGPLRCTIGLRRAEMLRPEVLSGVRSSGPEQREKVTRMAVGIEERHPRHLGCECSRPRDRPRWLGPRGMGWYLIAHCR